MFAILSQCALNACGPDSISPARMLELAEAPHPAHPGRTLQLASVHVGVDRDVSVICCLILFVYRNLTVGGLQFSNTAQEVALLKSQVVIGNRLPRDLLASQRQ